jgi:hypothetical protein
VRLRRLRGAQHRVAWTAFQARKEKESASVNRGRESHTRAEHGAALTQFGPGCGERKRSMFACAFKE